MAAFLLAIAFALAFSRASAAKASAAPPSSANTTILALSGSLRRLSSNSALARAAAASSPLVALAPRLDALPFFDADREVPLPPPVAALRAAAFAARGFFFATPEYNGATSAVLKNAIDWLSRAGPEGVSPLKGKPFVVVSAGGGGGGMRGQANVHAVAAASGMAPVASSSGPPLAIKLFDGAPRFSPDTGDLVEPASLARVAALVAELLEAARGSGATARVETDPL